jgi:hypothetical protein
MYFTRSGQKQIFENQIQIEFDSVDRGGWLGRDVAAIYWAIPIRYGIEPGPLDLSWSDDPESSVPFRLSRLIRTVGSGSNG